MSILGNDVRRVEDEHLLRGQGSYVANVPLDGSLAAWFVTSPVASATIAGIDVSEAMALDGVVAIVTADDFGELEMPSPLRGRGDLARPLLARGRVRYVGEPIALVLATSPQVAEDAAELVDLDLVETDPVIDPERALEDLQLVHEGSNLVSEGGEAEPEDFFADADVVVRARLVNQRLAPAPMEARAVAAVPTADGRLEVFASTQSAHRLKAEIVRVLGLADGAVVVRAGDVGGGFGAKAAVYPEDLAVCAAALRLGRPIRWIETRSASMLGLAHGRGQVQQVAIGARRDGAIVGLSVDVLQDVGAWPLLGPMLPRLTTLMAQGTYEIPRVRVAYRSVLTNTVPISAYRGAGRPEAAAAIEHVVDLLAHELDIDPAELRRRNLIADDAFPYETRTGARYDSGRYRLALERALEVVGYDALRAEQARRLERGARRLLGIGLSSYVEITNGYTSSEYARVEVADDGTLTVWSGTSPHGQGHHTTWAMIAAEQLGMPIDRIRVVTGDTDAVPRGVGTFGSRSVQTGGVAVHLASVEVAAAARELASTMLEAAPEDLVVGESGIGVVGVPSSVVSWATLATEARARGLQLAATVDFEPPGPTFPFGAHACVVEVDLDTGAVEVVDYVAVDDAGRILNPLLAEGQVHGGLAQGIAQAVLEEFVYAPDGAPLTGTLASYEMVSAPELPSFRVVHEETPTPVNPLGAKGIGESGTIGATPAVWNAVLDALRPLGVRDIAMPTTPERVVAALRAARAGVVGAGFTNQTPD